MLNEIKAEFKKIFTIRSTYIILGLILILVCFFGFYVGGWHSNKLDLINPQRLYMVSIQAIGFMSTLGALISILLFTHEFRYNTVAYTLTLSNSRNKVFLSKIIVISMVALTTTAVVGALSPTLAYLGIHANHLQLVPQHFYYSDILWKGLVFGWGSAMAGFVIAALIRNQIGAIVTFLIVPSTVEGLLSIWLKSNTDYLPFTALHTMLGAGNNGIQNANLKPLEAMFVFLGYLVVSGAISWVLFNRRDAN